LLAELCPVAELDWPLATTYRDDLGVIPPGHLAGKRQLFPPKEAVLSFRRNKAFSSTVAGKGRREKD
jgi:hypothetical protein